MSITPVTYDPRPTPYVGVRPFDTDDRRLFFGRTRETQELTGLWQRNRLTILHGSAGVGKTSLLRAGAVPQLMSEAAHVLPLGHIAHRSAFPMAALPEQNPFTFALLSSWYPSESPTRVSGLSITGFLRRHARTDRFGSPLRTFVVIDQAELLFRPSDTHERQRLRFLDELVDALTAHPNMRLLVAVREDHLDETLTFAERLGEGSCTQYALRPFDRSSAIEAVKRPLDGADRSFGPDTAERLVDELRTIRTPRGKKNETTSVIDPALLQLVCARLWADLPTDTGSLAGQLAFEVDRALTEFCAQALATVAADHRLPPNKVDSWFRTAFADQPGSGAVLEGPKRTQGIPNSVVRAVEDRHLIKARRQSGARWYELQHPRLLKPIHQLGNKLGPIRRPEPPARLRAAELALSEGDFNLARRHVEGAKRACGKDEMRILADAESFLGNIAHAKGEPVTAAGHYRKAAGMFEALQDTSAVGRLLAALGRLKLTQGADAAEQRANATEAVKELRAAAGRIPNDLVVQTGLGQALWHAGQAQAALAVLNAVLTHDGDTPEALRTRGEFLADLGDAESALRDLSRVDRHARPSTQAAWALALALRHQIETAQYELDNVVADASDNGPVLFRAARVQRLSGDPVAAAGLVTRALAAKHPPLPPHLYDAAQTLLHEL
ncbi:MAG: hypothetical protein JWL58_2846 [Streptosporangiaceae bacterium]|jgi:tetratricopeptide (TPR) repeat protein|nr:hypothetical protein [Streptosporangiaceae bacterium]